MNKTELYGKVYDRLKNPEAFTSLWFAKNAEGRSVSWEDPEAVKFDLMGAFLKESGPQQDLCNEALDELGKMLPSGYTGIGVFSEKAGHAAVVLLLERALGLVVIPEVSSIVSTEPAVKKKPGKRGRRPKKT